MAEITALTELQQMNLDILRLVQSDTAAAENLHRAIIRMGGVRRQGISNRMLW